MSEKDASSKIALDEFEGFMVMGLVSEGTESTPCTIPVLSTSARSAMVVASESKANFQPVGVISETELKAHLQAIQAHRDAVRSIA